LYETKMQDDDAKDKDPRDRRRSYRFPDSRRVYFRILRPLIGEGFTQNMSEDGCCILLSEELPLGTIIELLISEPEDDAKQYKILGKVVWQTNFLTGIEFLPAGTESAESA